MRTIATSLKKCRVSVCGCGPSDCQYWAGDGLRSAGTPKPGLCVDTVHEARLVISRRFGGSGGEGEGEGDFSSSELGVLVSRFVARYVVGWVGTVVLHCLVFVLDLDLALGLWV